MENLAIVSILGLILAIFLGFLRNVNVGIISIGISFLLSRIYNLETKAVLAGFDTSLFITMLGVTYLFSIVNANQTLKLASEKIVKKVGNKTWLLPIVLYIMGFVMSFIGPGAIPCLAIMPIIAVPIALQSGYNPIMLSVIAVSGVMGARMSPITPEGVLVIKLLADQGITNATSVLFASMFAKTFVNAILVFIIFKGWKIKKSIEVEQHDIPQFNKNQIISLVGLFIMIVCALFFKMNVGLVSFFIGSILVLIGVAKDSDCIKGVPWNVLLLVSGVGMLMKIVLNSGGIDILVNVLSALMGEKTASAIMVSTAGIMSFFSSGLGVIFPTLIPTVGGIAANVGGATNAIELAAMVVVGGTVTGVSPISTTGALIIAAVSSNKEASELYPSNKMFSELFALAFVFLIVSSLMSLIGIYNIIASIL